MSTGHNLFNFMMCSFVSEVTKATTEYSYPCCMNSYISSSISCRQWLVALMFSALQYMKDLQRFISFLYRVFNIHVLK